MATMKRYESNEPGTRKWLDGLGFKGYGPAFAARVWERVQRTKDTVGEAVAAERAAGLAKVAEFAPADPFEGLA